MLFYLINFAWLKCIKNNALSYLNINDIIKIEMKRFCFVLLTCILALNIHAENWVGTWATAPQLITSDNNPPQPGLSNNAIRQIVRVSIGGHSLRLKLSNLFSDSPSNIKSVFIAVAKDGSKINTKTVKYLTFDHGKKDVTIPAGSSVFSDPLEYNLQPLQCISITINYGEMPKQLTGHPGSRTTSYIVSGEATPKTNFSKSATTEHWYSICGIDVDAPAEAGCIAVLGNSITDGRATTTNMQNRWTDILATQLHNNPATSNLGVLNLGIGGNSVNGWGNGQNAATRFNRDILDQSGVKYLIIFEGVNDLGCTNDGVRTANELIATYKRMIAKAHSHGIPVYGGTITPFKNHSYYSEQHEIGRGLVNQWIRYSGYFDAVIDFDKTMRNESDTLSLKPTMQDDYLHPNAAGYKLMGESVDLNLFTRKGIALTQPKDKKFYIYLAFGQSNMEGGAPAEAQDMNVNPRFKVMQAVDCDKFTAKPGEWRTAVPPLCNCTSGITPADYFGRTLVDKLPDDVTVGVINVAVAGCNLSLFDKTGYKKYIAAGIPNWMQQRVDSYEGNPYAYLIKLARKAQQDGVIKGILLHQGETNTGDEKWPENVRSIYYDMLLDLHLNPDSVPLIAGELVNADQKGCCAAMNPIIDKLPRVIPNSFVVSSAGVPCNHIDYTHFTSAGYRMFGKRYANQVLKIMGLTPLSEDSISAGVPASELYDIDLELVNNSLTIGSKSKANTLMITDILGKVVFKKKVSYPGKMKFTLPTLSKGIYFVTLRDNDAVVSTNKFNIK